MNEALSLTDTTEPVHSTGVVSESIETAEPAVHYDSAARYAAVCAGAVEYLPNLRGYASALAGSRSQADDLVQSAILRALDAADQFTPGTNFKAWAFTILRNVFYNQWRSPASRNVALEDCNGYTPVTAATQDSGLEFCDFRRAFAQLVPEQREALLLIGAAGLEYGEVAAICGCAPGTVKSRVSRARANLRILMDGGALNLRRREVVPISMLDLALALEGSGVALTHPVRHRSAVARPRDGASIAVTPPMPSGFEVQPLL